MTLEDQHTDRKSLRIVAGKTADWEALARDRVCFANGAGGRLQALALVQTAGRTQGTRYFVDPALLRGADLKLPTTLLRIEPHRLRALILEDEGERRWRRYRPAGQEHKGHGAGQLP